MKQISNDNLTVFDKIHAKLCGRVYLFLYKLTGLCEDRKLKRDIAKALQDAEENKNKVEYLEEKKEVILGGFEELKQRILELENELEHYRTRENMLSNYVEEVAYLKRIIDKVYSMSAMCSVEEIHQFLTQFKIRG